MKRYIFALVAASCFSVLSVAQTITPECRKRAEDLTARMTIEEKLDYIGGWNVFYIRPVDRLGIPEIRMADGPQGVRNDTKSTLYPCGVAAAATWNRTLMRQMGESLGRDARSRGVHILLGPGVNIYRMPLCGRNFEYFGEDPCLTSRMAVEYVKGVQSEGVMATVKHFAANNEEYDRHHVSSEVDERTLNEIYLPAFKAAVREAGVGSVMTSYNLLNGVHTAQSPYLIGQTLRGDWGFEGMVMSDWKSVYSPLQAAVSGIDIEMPEGACLSRENLLPLIENGVLPVSRIDEKVTRILQSLIAFGFLDRPQKDSSIPEDDPLSDETARKVAEESIVMLENRSALPLEGTQDIVLMGPYSCSVPFGGGSGSVDPLHTVTLYEGLKKVRGYNVEYLGDSAEGLSGRIGRASAVILSLGFDKNSEKENSDRSFTLPEEQLKLIETASALNDNVIVVVCAGGSVEMASWKDRVSAVLWGWYYGQQGGTALAEIISGKISPSGRLPMSFERSLEDNPCFSSYHPDREYMKRSGADLKMVTYREGIFMGYRGYDRNGKDPLYPFGYGLTYGDFEYSDLSVKQDGDNVRVNFTLRNNGSHEAAEVVQVYVGQHNPSVPRPLRELKQFSKIRLAPGEEKAVSLNLGKDAFSHYDADSHSWKTDCDSYTISVGASERDIRLSQDISYRSAAARTQPGGYSVTYKEFGMYRPPLECIGKISTAKSGEVSAERWSVGCECLDRDMAVWSEFADYVPELGVGHARITSGWAKTERRTGHYDYAWLDEIVDGLCSRNIKPWMTLCYGNPIYGAELSLGAKIFTDEDVFKAWERYVFKTVERYRDRVHCWEIWNEPNISANTPQIYAKLIERTSAAIRRADPTADIAAFALASVDRKFLNAVLDILKEKGETDLFNMVTLHKYYENPDDCDYDFAVLTDDILKFNPSITVIQGESGCPSRLEFDHALKYQQMDEKIQAKTVLRRMACDFSAGRPCSIFTMVDLVYPNMQQSFGLLRTDLKSKVIYRKPAFYAVRNMVNMLNDGIEPYELEFSANISATVKLTGLREKGSGKTVGLMYYLSDNAAVSALSWDSMTVTFKDFKLANPVLVEPVTGNVYKLSLYHYSPNSPDTKFTNLPVWDSPLLLISSDVLSVEPADDNAVLTEF